MPVAKLFKYMTAATGRIVLENQTLRYSKPAILNDPYDMQLNLRFDLDEEKLRTEMEQVLKSSKGKWYISDKKRKVNKILKKEGKRISKKVALATALENSKRILTKAIKKSKLLSSKFFENCRVLCFSENPVSALMWSHYADEHNGIVLEFENFTCVDDVNCPEPKNVVYQEEIPEAFTEKEAAVLMVENLTKESCGEIIEKHLFTKSKEWEYEQEKRIWIGDRPTNPFCKNDFQDISFKSEELKSIILGCRISEDDKVGFEKIIKAKYPHVKIFRIEKNSEKFQYEIVSC